MNWETLCDYGHGFGLSDDTMDSLKSLYLRTDQHLFEDAFGNLCQHYDEARVQNTFTDVRDQNMFRLLCVIANYQNLKESYQRQNFPPKMFTDIIGDLKVWLNTTTPDWGYPGLSARIIQWFISILNGGVKQFGRLQCNTFHLFALKKSIYRTDAGQIDIKDWNDPDNQPHPDLAYQDKVVNIHIPACGKLLANDCIQSLLDMNDFMKAFRPDYDIKAFVCYSWLLSPFFKQTLKPNSNIRRFQELGHVFTMPDVDEAAEIKWRLWGDNFLNTPPDQLPADNSIRQAVARQLKQGEKIPCGCMVIFPDELTQLPGRQ